MTEMDSTGGSFADPSQAARFRDIINNIIESKLRSTQPETRTGMILDIYQGGAVFNSGITVDSTEIPRTADNPERTFIALVRCDDKWEGEILEARIDPNYIPIFRKADFFDEDNPAGSGTMVDRAGRYVIVGDQDGDLGPLLDAYPSLTGTTLLAPQAAPRVAITGASGSWRVSSLIRGVLAAQVTPGTLMTGPEFASFNTTTLQWGGTIAFARGAEIRTYEITPDAPIITYGSSEALEVSETEPVEIILGQRSGSMYINFSSIDNVPVLVWVEAGSDIPIPPEWYLVFARINEGDISSKLIFASQTDFRSPGAPTGFTVSWAKSGYEKISISASWDAVTIGTNGDPIQVSSYELWGTLDGEEERRITTVTETHVAGLTFDAGTDWHFRVRAIGSNGIPGVFSFVQSESFPPDDTVLGGGSKTYWQADKPTEGNPGDEWFDTDDGNAHYIYDDVADDYILAPFGSGALDSIITTSISNAISDAADALTVANTKGSNYWQGTEPTGGIYSSYDTWFNTSDDNKPHRWSGSAWVPMELGTNAIANLAINNSKIGNLNAGKIDTGFLDAARIAANSITAEKVLLTGANLIPDPSLQSVATWYIPASATRSDSGGYSGDGILTFPASATTQDAGLQDTLVGGRRPFLIPATPGFTYYISARVKSIGGPTVAASLYVGVLWYDATGAAIGSIELSPAAADGIAADTWTQVVTNSVAPVGAAWAGIIFRSDATQTTSTIWSTPVAIRMASSELIVDGAITTSKMVAGAITAGSAIIADGAIQNAQISELSVDKLTGGTLTADVQISGSFRTPEVSGMGQVITDSSGIRVIDGDGTPRTSFDTTGQSYFYGNVEASGVEVIKLKMTGNLTAPSEIAAGAVLNISGGVSAPVNAPIITPHYPTYTFKGPGGVDVGTLGAVFGIAFDSANNQFVTGVAITGSNTKRAYRHNPDGSYVSTVGDWPSTSLPCNGVGISGGTIWMAIGESTYTLETGYGIKISIVSLTGVTKVVFTDASFGFVPFPSFHMCNATSTQVAIAYQSDKTNTTKRTVCLFNVSTSAKTSSFITNFSHQLAYGDIGNGTRYFLPTTAGVRQFTTAGVEQTSEVFPISTSTLTSAAWDIRSGTILSIFQSGESRWYSGPWWATGDEPVFTYTWRDTDSGGSGQHETAESPLSNPAAPKKRAEIDVLIANLPYGGGVDDVNSARLYAGKGLSGTRYQQAEGMGPTFLIQTLASSGNTPGGIASFPYDSPGVIKNDTGDIYIPGAGRAKIVGVTEPIELGAGVDLNDLQMSGLYFQSDAGEATTALNYPFNGAVGAIYDYTLISAFDVVQRKYQMFQVRNTTNDVYVRSYFIGDGTPWSPWTRMNRARRTANTAYIAAAGWNVTTFNLSESGNIAQLSVVASRTGAAITVPADGNITNSLILTLTDCIPLQGVALAPYHTGPIGVGYVAPVSGNLQIVSVAPGVSINTGSTFSFGGTWITS